MAMFAWEAAVLAVLVVEVAAAEVAVPAGSVEGSVEVSVEVAVPVAALVLLAGLPALAAWLAAEAARRQNFGCW